MKLKEEFIKFSENKEKLISDTFYFKNKKLPIIQAVDELKAEYKFIDIRKDKVKMLDQQLANIEKTMQAKTDYIPFLAPWHSIGEYADAFGSKQKWYDDRDPVTLPAINNTEDVYDLKPDLKNSKLMNMTLDTIRYFQNKIGTSIPISTCAPIGPFLLASMIMNPNIFFISLLTNKKEMHYLIDLCTKVFIEFYDRQLDIIKNPALPGIEYVYSKNAEGIIISADSLAQVSPDIFEEYSVPAIEKIADKFNGIILHSCGNWMHNLDVVLKIRGLKGLNFHSSPIEMDPEIVLKKIRKSKKNIHVLTDFGKIGIRWTDYFKNEKDAYSNWYLKKILYNGIPTGVFISTFDNYPDIPKYVYGIGRENVSIEKMNNDYTWIRAQIEKILSKSVPALLYPSS